MGESISFGDNDSRTEYRLGDMTITEKTEEVDETHHIDIPPNENFRATSTALQTVNEPFKGGFFENVGWLVLLGIILFIIVIICVIAIIAVVIAGNISNTPATISAGMSVLSKL